jgi:glutathione synthase/RimK-type ligase-like ATP-grasp enzyme
VNRDQQLSDCDVALAACDELPALTADDQSLLAVLRQRGLRAEPVVWTDRDVDWSGVRLCVIRSTWDYMTRLEAYLAWAERVEKVTALWNPLEVIRWNTHKSYLEELAGRGVRVVPTVWLEKRARVDLRELLVDQGWRDAVIKPAVSATARETIRLGPTGPAAAQAHLDRLLAVEDMLVQPFLHRVESEGELSLQFIDGEFTHAIRRRPEKGDYRVQDEFGGSMELVEAEADELQFGVHALQTARQETLYARVDVMRDDDGGLCLAELEMVEPMLYFRQHPLAAERFAAAILHRLQPA